MLKHLVPILCLLIILSGCDTNVRTVNGHRAYPSRDGERILVVHYQYEGFNNLVTNGTGPGSRNHEYNFKTIEAPEVEGDGIKTISATSVLSGDSFPFKGQIDNPVYIHNSARRFM